MPVKDFFVETLLDSKIPPKRRNKTYSEETMSTAILAVILGCSGVKQAALKYGVPYGTLSQKIRVMFGSRRKGGRYRKYDSQTMIDAAKSVEAGDMSMVQAAKFYNVPRETLRDTVSRNIKKGTNV